ncbi:MAG: hypothetical protein COB15_16765 [Flavobacteriales bacterium]|nr:MAG: hypothetical protein COB15_16765 [Flavobacteriales bacterium]
MNEKDDLLDEAIELSKTVSLTAEIIQTKLLVGFNRAQRLLSEVEKREVYFKYLNSRPLFFIKWGIINLLKFRDDKLSAKDIKGFLESGNSKEYNLENVKQACDQLYFASLLNKNGRSKYSLRSQTIHDKIVEASNKYSDEPYYAMYVGLFDSIEF